MADVSIIQSAQHRWQNLQPRERTALIVGAVALGLILAYLLLWSPLSERRAQLQGQVEARSAILARVLEAAAQVESLPGRSSQATVVDSVSVLTQIDQTARQAGLAAAIRRIEPVEDGVVRMQLDAAEFDGLIRWLEDIARQRNIRVTEARLSRTETPGEVDGQLVLNQSRG